MNVNHSALVSTLFACTVFVHVNSGVTRVGVTRGGRWWVSPYFSFFSHRLWKWRPFLAVVSSPLIFHVVYPVFFLNFAANNNFRSSVTPPWRLSPVMPLIM